MYTPWGMSNGSEKIIPGVMMVDTPSHGGFMVTKKKGDMWLSEEARSISEQYAPFATHYCFEEDCDWVVLMWEVKTIRDEVRRRHAFWNDSERYKSDLAYNVYLRDVLKSYRPDYLHRHPRPNGV